MSSNLTVHRCPPVLAQRDWVSPTTLALREFLGNQCTHYCDLYQLAFLRCLPWQHQGSQQSNFTLLESRGELTTVLISGQEPLNMIIATLLGIQVPTICWFDIHPLVISSHDHPPSTHLDSELVVMLEVRDNLDRAQCTPRGIVSQT